MPPSERGLPRLTWEVGSPRRPQDTRGRAPTIPTEGLSHVNPQSETHQSYRHHPCITPQRGTKRAKALGTRRENGPRHSAHPPHLVHGRRIAGPPSRRAPPIQPTTKHKPDSCDKTPQYEVCTMRDVPTSAHTHSLPDKASLNTKTLRSAMMTIRAPPPVPPPPEEATLQ